MNVLLTNPPAPKPQTREGRCTQSGGYWQTTWPPLSLATLSALLRCAQHQVSVLDCANLRTDLETFLNQAAAAQPDVIIWPVGNVSPDADLSLSQMLRELVPHVRSIVFGTFVGKLAQACIARYPEIDAVVLAEPEGPVLDLVNAWDSGNADACIKGTWTRSHMSRPHESRENITDLDALPFPAWDLVGPRKYCLPLSGRPFLMAAPSRGCPFLCSFCTSAAYYGKQVRKRSPGGFVDELERNVKDFGVYDFLFWSDTFTVVRSHVLSICEEISRRNLRIKWTCNSRVDTIDEEMIKEMATAGCWMISFGIESSSQDVQERAGKKIDPVLLNGTLAAANRKGILCAGHFIIGLPGETQESAMRTIGVACSLPLQFAQFYAAAPWPGSRLF
ncbi:MAG: radical SAM protein, partial [Chloroflexi bacterium]|nr:radical SAM protein [Chloroflexota bacterium]